MANPEEINEMPERRLVIIGARGEGKSSAANTILTKERFESSRTQTLQAEARNGIVADHHLVLVDTPGWKRSPSLNEISERDKQQFKLYASKCEPGPHAFLLVVPTDASFSQKEKKAVLDYMKLLGNRVWNHTMVLFTFGDYLGKKTIEQHIESEGAALTWLIGKCNDRYHVLNNKDKSNLSQVIQLLEKIDNMVRENNDGYYMLDNSAFHAIQKRDEVARKAEERFKRALKQQEELNKIVSEMKPIQKLQIILLGSHGVGKTSVMNTILGIKEQQEDETTVVSQLHEGRVGRMEIAVVDTPGWRKGSHARDTPEMIKDEVVQSLFKCHPGPDVLLLVIDADASFNRRHLEAATTHVELFGENVWKHTMVVFTRGDWLGSRSIEEYIEGEGTSMQYLLEICGNRYHVLDNMNEYDGAQVDKLLEKILQTLALNGGKHFAPKQEMVNALKENEKKVQLAVQRRNELKDTRGGKGPTKKLHEIKILILGEKKSGKTTAANLIVRDKVFSTQPNHGCMARQAPVADRQVTVVDTPGWAAEESQCTRGQDREIVNGLNLSPQGVDAVLIVLSLDLKFRKANLDALVDHITLFGDEIWNHIMVLFTNEDTLADKSLEEYIEKEDQALRQLVDRCGNNYHCLYILETRDDTQHIQLFKKIEDMSAKNQGRLFCPNMNDIYRSIDEKFQKRKIIFRNRVVQAFTSQRLELLRDHKTKLEKLHDNIKEIFASPFPPNKAKKTSVLSDIEEQIEELGRNIMKLNKSTNSMDISLIDMSPSTPEMDKVLEWMSQLQGNTDDYNSMLNMSESSGYRSTAVFPLDDSNLQLKPIGREIDEMPERRLVIIGARGDGKSSAANTILTKKRFKSSRTQTLRAKARHGIVAGRHLVLVDTPGWTCSSCFNKQQFNLYASKCQPGPHAFLLVVPTDASFSQNEKKAVLDYMKLLGNRVWSYTMVLFTFGDYLGNKTIEQHIESEGAALTWLIGKCNDRYHVLNNNDESNLSQVIQLLEKIDDMVHENNDGYYVLDDSVFHAIEKREEVAKKAEQQFKRALKQQEELNKTVSEMKPIQKLKIILLGSRGVGKTSVMNTVLGIQEQEDETTMVSQLHEGRVGRMEIAVVDTPGWRKGSSAHDTPEMIKDEVVQSLLKCRPGPDVFLLVIDADASFNRRHLEAATTHVKLFGQDVWKHTMVVFTRGDWLGSRSIEEYIEGEGKSLQYLLEICGNRYHVLDNMNEYDGAQVDKLLEKIIQTLALNGGKHFAPKQEMLNALREKEKKGPTKKLHEIKILILGEKKSGKTTAANLILRDKVFPTQPNHGCMARQAPVADRQVTVVDTPGWAEESQCTREQDREIVNGLNLSPQGVDAVLIVLSLDLKFRKANQDALVDHITLFGDKIWNHTMVLFTNEDTLADKSLEEYIEKEDQALRQLVDKCGNSYHCLNIFETRDETQHVQLFKKIEDMSAKNQGRLFCPNMNDIYRSIDEKFQKRKLINRNMVVQAFKSQSLALLRDHKTKLEKLHDNIKEIFASPFPPSKAKKKSVLSDIEEQIDELSRNIMKLIKSTNSLDILPPEMSQSTPEMDKVLEWMSQLQGNTDEDCNSMLNMSESSGYRSPPVFALDD
ncbi:uncharacterized protein [Syngnathus scovelli]|uniref:uncharacterized protein n=1 Tax=Syngnathus scovelli TaxID=161590 RepID=UPI0035CA393B